MGLTLAQALRLRPYERKGYQTSGEKESGPIRGWSAAFVGAGGKSTAIFNLARELSPPVTIATTTHLGAWEIPLADRHIVAETPGDLADFEAKGVTLITGQIDSRDRASAPSLDTILWLHAKLQKDKEPLLIEADGSHQRPLKAPAPHEPVIPEFADLVVTVAGLSGLGKPLSAEFVHRPEQFSALSGLDIGSPISAAGLVRVLVNDAGGCKGIPPHARRAILLNQADAEELQAQAHSMVKELLRAFDTVIIADLATSAVHAAHERVAGIVLAAGASKRLGRSKQLLDWHGTPFVRAVARTALTAGLAPVVVVTGSSAEEIEAAVKDLPVQMVRNDRWQSGQASSVQAGLSTLQDNIGAAVFLLADQPQMSHEVIEALMETHAAGLQPIVAPLVMMEQRANPVLFDRSTFADLMQLQGDVGGRAIFSKYPVEYMPWHDDRLLLDVDTEQDYRRLIEDDTL